MIVLSQLYALLYRLVVVIGAKATSKFTSKPATATGLFVILSLSWGFGYTIDCIFTEPPEVTT